MLECTNFSVNNVLLNNFSTMHVSFRVHCPIQFMIQNKTDWILFILYILGAVLCQSQKRTKEYPCIDFGIHYTALYAIALIYWPACGCAFDF